MFHKFLAQADKKDGKNATFYYVYLYSSFIISLFCLFRWGRKQHITSAYPRRTGWRDGFFKILSQENNVLS